MLMKMAVLQRLLRSAAAGPSSLLRRSYAGRRAGCCTTIALFLLLCSLRISHHITHRLPSTR